MARIKTALDLPGVRVKSGKLEVTVKIGDGPTARRKYARLPLDTSREDVERWQADAREELKKDSPEHGSLNEAVEKFLGTMSGRRKEDFEDNLKPWQELYGKRPRLSLTKQDCRDAFDKWLGLGLSASTLNHRRQALISLYTDRDGEEDANCPASKIGKFKEPKPERRAMDAAKLDAALTSIEDSASKARLMLILYTGARPAEIGRLVPESIDLVSEIPSITYTTAKAGDDRAVPLASQQARAAAEMFVRFKAFGTFSNSSLGKTLRVAWVRSQLDPELKGAERRKRIRELLAEIRQKEYASGIKKWRLSPYVLRHTCFTELRKAGADLADVAAIAGHKSPVTTKRYAPTVNEKLAAAMARIDRAPVAADGTPDGTGQAAQPVANNGLKLVRKSA